MNSCSDPLSHAPGYQTVHMMPKAGMASDMVSADSEVFRYNRVTPYYPNDPCIRPNEADFTCPADRPGNQNHLLPSAGVSTAHGDTFQNYQTRGPLTQGQCMGAYGSHPCRNTQPITGPEDCPCSNRCKPRKYAKPYDLRLMYPKCVDRPATPHFVTPIYNFPSTYFTAAPVAPHVFLKVSQPCRSPWSKHMTPECPGGAPRQGGDLAMFMGCHGNVV